MEKEFKERKRSHAHRIEKKSDRTERAKHASIRREMFSKKSVPEESLKIIDKFDEVISDVRSLSGKQRVGLYPAIKQLSHQLTSDRNSRRLGYMNEAEYVSAYVNYFMWWNLVRLTRLFANLPKTAFSSLVNSENPVAIDVGSGTLTVVTALWLARPELRSKKISWYCMDLSQGALSVGENLYLSVAAKTLSMTKKDGEAGENTGEDSAMLWKIIRVKGALGTPIKEKADFISCANVFNEILQRNEMPTDFLAKKYASMLLSYLKDADSTVLLVEPGDPHSARFISLMREALIRQNYAPVSPCPHSETCPMAGRTGGKTTDSYGKNAKWCNFAFDTEDAPEKLLKISEKAGLPKERAGLSFIVSKKIERAAESDSAEKIESEKTFIRIASDFIRLPELHKSGYYACSRFGLLLAIDDHQIHPVNGELLQINTPKMLNERDKKSGALIVRI